MKPLSQLLAHIQCRAGSAQILVHAVRDTATLFADETGSPVVDRRRAAPKPELSPDVPEPIADAFFRADAAGLCRPRSVRPA